MLPYDCDALLPAAQRYISPRYLRVSEYIQIRLLEWEELVELVGFVESIGGPRFARFILRWRGPAVVRAYFRIRAHVGDAADEAIRANLSAFSVDVGLAVLRAMQEGGWKGRRYPPVVKGALKELRKAGNSIAAIAKATGLTVDQVSRAVDQRGSAVSARAAALSSLAVG